MSNIDQTQQSKRLFFALPLTSEQKSIVQTWRSAHLPSLHKPVNASNFHLTLRYIGNCPADAQNKLELAAVNIRSTPLQLNLDIIGHFKKPKVLYLGTSKVPDSLKILARDISAMVDNTLALNHPSDSHKFTPHITLARKVIKPIFPSPATFNLPLAINKYSLFESVSTDSGVVYNELKSWSLG
ncbi:RNA 2',3'-cyclic phosphodiesterase [Thalassotalea mangrovi]|uniref:RNA 2',3'-cyclic phosphodiesterase n=1 Tax=Thalassotalea mangrovi TaxID=2572245 RepID=A0A4U1B683_9GAMM|nr:RNA 2',3'-cyclic phosphodiesterase [Thalassotalea mangrovi]TKB45352.1 RNA 2',3'-cyclic phosphodiesterase [Thalassotalea mangrovi]